MNIKKYIPSAVITAIFIACLFTEKIGVGDNHSIVIQATAYHFYHANIFHFLLNIIALWTFHPRWKTVVVAFIASSVVAALPFASLDTPTYGLSGMIFAAYARKFATWRLSVKWILLSNIALMFIPHVNVRIHLMAFGTSYIYWYLWKLMKS